MRIKIKNNLKSLPSMVRDIIDTIPTIRIAGIRIPNNWVYSEYIQEDIHTLQRIVDSIYFDESKCNLPLGFTEKVYTLGPKFSVENLECKDIHLCKKTKDELSKNIILNSLADKVEIGIIFLKGTHLSDRQTNKRGDIGVMSFSTNHLLSEDMSCVVEGDYTVFTLNLKQEVDVKEYLSKVLNAEMEVIC